MSTESPNMVRVANFLSEVLYTIAGVLLIGLGTLGFVLTTLRSVSKSAPSEPTLSAIVIFFSLLFFASGIFVTPPFRHRVSRRKSLTQFGKSRSVETRTLHSEEQRTDACVACGRNADEGLLRRYREELYVAGMPVYTGSEQYNLYCVECATTEFTTTGELKEDDIEMERN